MGWLIGLLAPRLGKTLASVVVYGGLLLILALGVWWLRDDAYKDGKRDEHAAIQRLVDEANRRFLEQKRRADELAANQRITDTIAVSRQEQELRDAIRSTPDSAPDAVRIRLGCERLRRAPGANPANLPAVCRSNG